MSSALLLIKDEVFSVSSPVVISRVSAKASDVAIYPPATRAIPSQTTVDISPVLLFEKEEYATHGRYTILNHYTFVWKNGQYALALGLGETPLSFPCVFVRLSRVNI